MEWCLYKSENLSKHFKDVVCKVHSGTTEFEKDETTQIFNPNFEDKFISKLKKEIGTSELDKVRIASDFAKKIEDDDNLIIDEEDKHIKYLVDAIKHACSYEN